MIGGGGRVRGRPRRNRRGSTCVREEFKLPGGRQGVLRCPMKPSFRLFLKCIVLHFHY